MIRMTFLVHRSRYFSIFALLTTVIACTPARGTIGALLTQSTEGELTVRDIPEGLAADQAGLQPGDRILLVEGIDVRRLDEKALHRALGGEVGSSVHLTVQRGDQILRIALRRSRAEKNALTRSESNRPNGDAAAAGKP